jgi:hypothetical protein
MTRGERFYELLLRLYPAEFRARYGRAMRDFQRDRLALAAQHRESIAALWVRTVGDVVAGRRGASALVRLRRRGRRHAAAGSVRSSRPAATAAVRRARDRNGRPRRGRQRGDLQRRERRPSRPLLDPARRAALPFGHEPPQWLTSEPDFVDYKREMKSIAGLAAYDQRTATLSATVDADSRPERVGVARASEGFFDVIGAKPVLGRTFVADDHDSKIARVAVLSYGLWQRDFAGSRSVIGRTINLDGAPRVVIGVMAPRFEYPKATTGVWIPRARFNLDSLGDRNQHYLFMVGRLRSAHPRPGSRRSARRRSRDHARRAGVFDLKASLTPHLSACARSWSGRHVRTFALLGAVGFILAASRERREPAAGARSGREKELAVRAALGASRRRLSCNCRPKVPCCRWSAP